MAKAAGISLRSVQCIWAAHDLQSHRVRTFKRSRDPRFADKLVDIVGLYLDPPAHGVVLSIDEKSQIRALDRTQPGLPLKPGRCGTMTHDYKPPRHDEAVRRPQRARRDGDRALHSGEICFGNIRAFLHPRHGRLAASELQPRRWRKWSTDFARFCDPDRPSLANPNTGQGQKSMIRSGKTDFLRAATSYPTDMIQGEQVSLNEEKF